MKRAIQSRWGLAALGADGEYGRPLTTGQLQVHVRGQIAECTDAARL
jgi:hypothetical protein